jgi:aldose 1-epimerase
MNMSSLHMLAVLAIVFSCNSPGQKRYGMEQQTNGFNDTVQNKIVELFRLSNSKGMEVLITNYGATVVSIKVPDRAGRSADVVLGYDSIAGYYQGGSYFGCIVGRYGNRIAGGRFTLDGKTYQLATNNGPNSLHGGTKGFDKVVWDAKQEGNVVVLSYTSADGEEGYPGNLTVNVRYELPGDSNELRISYTATTDKPTVLNVTNHSYFNLEGQGKGNILDHEMMINADGITVVDSTLIPTGDIAPVAGTAFDFRKPRKIGERINDTSDLQILYGLGYDHNFVLNGAAGAMKLAARVVAPGSGRVLEVHTTEPGVQFYSGNFLDGKEKGKGSIYTRRTGFCLETQHFPDAPNKPSFPGTVLRPGEQFTSNTVFRFSTQ